MNDKVGFNFISDLRWNIPSKSFVVSKNFILSDLLVLRALAIAFKQSAVQLTQDFLRGSHVVQC